MPEAKIGSYIKGDEFNGVSSTAIAISSLPKSSTSTSTSNDNSSSASSSNSLYENGIVIGGCNSFMSLLAFIHPEILTKKDNTKNQNIILSQQSGLTTSLTTNRCSAIMSSHALHASSAQIIPKMLTDINLTDSVINHKINQSHSQMVETQKVHPIQLPEDPRTLQLALELSLVGLNENNQNSYVQPNSSHGDFEMSSINIVSAAYARTEMSLNNLPLPPSTGSGLLMPSSCLEDRSKKSQNMTECVPVPSSEHVAEIVGRQGCKIKALRAKTNTYIKTPVRGEEPVFVVTGRKEDVNKAKREILSAADHFSLIRASRKPSVEGLNMSGISGNGNCNGNHNGMGVDNGIGNGIGNGISNGNSVVNGIGNGNMGSLNVGIVSRAQSGPPCLPGQITIQVRVPYRVVGLVVGPKGATIKHIQQETQTYIVTPSREKEPIFEVTGLPENVETARKQIQAHIALRTGNSAQGSEISESNERGALHTINTLTQILNDDLNSDILSSIYKSGISPTVNYTCGENSINVNVNNIDSGNISNHQSTSSIIMNPPMSVHNLSNCFQNSDTGPILTADKAFTLQEMNGQPSKANTNSLFRNIGLASHKPLSFLPPSVSVSGSGSSNIQSTNASSIPANILTRSCSSASSTASTKSTNNSANSSNSVNTPPEILNIWKNLNDSIDVDEGIGDSPSIWNLPSTTATMAASHCSPTASISPTDSLLGDHSLNVTQKMGNTNIHGQESCPNSNSVMPQQHATGGVQINQDKLHSLHRECFVCNEREVTTALVPCGHNMFCMDCANQICVSMESICPICHSIVYHAMRIIA